MLRYVPKHDDSCTRSAARRRASHQAGTRIVSWTEDCFDGAVKTAARSSVEGDAARPRQSADRAVLHRGRASPATPSPCISRSRAGARLRRLVVLPRLRRARRHGPHGDARRPICPRRRGATTSTRRRRRAHARAATASTRGKFRSRRSSAASAWRRRAAKCARTIVPGPFGGNMDCPEVRAGNTVFLGVNVPGRAPVVRRRPLRDGRRRDHGRRDRRRDECRGVCRAAEGQRDAGAAHRERRRDDVRRHRDVRWRTRRASRSRRWCGWVRDAAS